MVVAAADAAGSRGLAVTAAAVASPSSWCPRRRSSSRTPWSPTSEATGEPAATAGRAATPEEGARVRPVRPAATPAAPGPAARERRARTAAPAAKAEAAPADRAAPRCASSTRAARPTDRHHAVHPRRRRAGRCGRHQRVADGAQRATGPRHRPDRRAVGERSSRRRRDDAQLAPRSRGDHPGLRVQHRRRVFAGNDGGADAGRTDTGTGFVDGPRLCANDDCDGDGYSPPGATATTTDPLINPEAYDFLADGVDNDCDGNVDDPVLTCETVPTTPPGTPTDFARAADLCAQTPRPTRARRSIRSCTRRGARSQGLGPGQTLWTSQTKPHRRPPSSRASAANMTRQGRTMVGLANGPWAASDPRDSAALDPTGFHMNDACSDIPLMGHRLRVADQRLGLGRRQRAGLGRARADGEGARAT